MGLAFAFCHSRFARVLRKSASLDSKETLFVVGLLSIRRVATLS